MTVVIDACVIVALVTPDPRQDAVQNKMNAWLDDDEEIHAPAVLPYEIANVLARLAHDGDIDADDVTDIWTDLSALRLRLHPFKFTHDGPAVADLTARLRRRHATDSAYIRLALELETEVWTIDGSLARGASDIGLPVRMIT